MDKLLCRVVASNCFDVYSNLALEEYLLGDVKQDEVVMYLWQNDQAVVIGRNQNMVNECNIDFVFENRGKIARRLSGGGAVYHDRGNLNFTFIMANSLFDIQKQFEVILHACERFGIVATKNERNDLLVNGGKFSGNAFYYRKNASLHHGTILVNSDIEAMNQSLRFVSSSEKSRAIQSVSSPVINLSSLNPRITVTLMRQALQESLASVYQGHLHIEDPYLFNWHPYLKRYGSREWMYGKW